MSTTFTKDRFKIAVSSMPGPWDTCSDPELTRPMTKRRAEAGAPKTAVGGDLEFGDITITRFWDEVRDSAIVAQCERSLDFYNDTVVSLTALGSDGVPFGAAKSYTGSISGVKRVGADANSADEGKLEVTLTIASAA